MNKLLFCIIIVLSFFSYNPVLFILVYMLVLRCMWLLMFLAFLLSGSVKSVDFIAVLLIDTSLLIRNTTFPFLISILMLSSLQGGLV